ncbi:MAG: hypothetical protein IPK10_05475 [Bacteroidetes bacterium]|nr:hypothetical protein [Bacteroidota bacterium]
MPPAYNQVSTSPTVLYLNNSVSNIPTCVCDALNDVVDEYENLLSVTYT